jgi:hypothetical protein
MIWEGLGNKNIVKLILKSSGVFGNKSIKQYSQNANEGEGG